LAGFPHHSLETYLHKLVKAGYRVAVCDQLEDPKQAKGIVKRGVTEMVTPGVAINDKLLEHNTNNFLCGIHIDEHNHGIAFLDISTGEFFVAEGDEEYIEKLLETLKPAEIVFEKKNQKTFREKHGLRFYTYPLESWIFDKAYSEEQLLKQFGTHSLKGFGIDRMSAAIIAAGAILHYLKDTEHPHLKHLTSISRLDRNEHVWMDQFTIQNLELLDSGKQGSVSLINTLDHTVSPMGGRLLKRWLLLPILDKQRIEERLDLVEYFTQQPELRENIAQVIKSCGDMERLISKVPSRKINPREVRQLARGLHQVFNLKALTKETSQSYLQKLGQSLDQCRDIQIQIEQTISEDPPAQINKGGLIADGVNAELDELRQISSNGKEYLVTLQQQEISRTGINSLKIGYNNVFGYYLEVTHAHKDKVPSDWNFMKRK